jgi:hypothetical protein
MAELALDAVQTVAVQHPGGQLEVDYKNYAKVCGGVLVLVGCSGACEDDASASCCIMLHHAASCCIAGSNDCGQAVRVAAAGMLTPPVPCVVPGSWQRASLRTAALQGVALHCRTRRSCWAVLPG